MFMKTMGTPEDCEELSQELALARVSSMVLYRNPAASVDLGKIRRDRKQLDCNMGKESFIFLSQG